jgi:hypothetical protein
MPELDRLGAQRLAPAAGRLVAQGARQPGQEPGPDLRVLVADRGEPLVQERQQVLVGAGTRVDDPSAVLRGGAGQLARQPPAPRDARGLEQGTLGARRVPGL